MKFILRLSIWFLINLSFPITAANKIETNFPSKKIEFSGDFVKPRINSINPNFNSTPYSGNLNKPFSCKIK